MTNNNGFDQYADRYDAWFMENLNVLYSEAALVASTLKGAGRILSVGCGSGLFEQILARDYDIHIVDGIEPSAGMAAISTARGMKVQISTAEDAEIAAGEYDTILFNGTPSYITQLKTVIEKVYKALPERGRIVLIDVPKESSYGLLYNLAKAVGTWDHPLLEGCVPPNPYPIEFVKVANWRTTAEKVKMLEEAGFKSLQFSQTLTRHPLNSNRTFEAPIEGSDSGDYVAIVAWK